MLEPTYEEFSPLEVSPENSPEISHADGIADSPLSSSLSSSRSSSELPLSVKSPLIRSHSLLSSTSSISSTASSQIGDNSPENSQDWKIVKSNGKKLIIKNKKY